MFFSFFGFSDDIMLPLGPKSTYFIPGVTRQARLITVCAKETGDALVHSSADVCRGLLASS